MTKVKFQKLFRILLTGMIIFLFSSYSIAQSFVLDVQYNAMSFTNAQKTIITDNGNNGEKKGSVHKYNNVITIDGITVYAYLTILDIKNADIRNFDDDSQTGDSKRFQPRIGSTKRNKGGHVRYQLEFFNAANNESVFLYNYWLTGVDIDGSSSSNGYREFVEVSGYTSYQVDENTMLTVTADNNTGTTRFEGRKGSLSGVTFDNTASFIANYANANNKITFTLGITKEKVTERYFSVQFGAPDSDGPFDKPVIVTNPLPVAIDDIGVVVDKSTGGVSVNNVLDNDLFDGSAVVPSEVYISLVSAASNNGVVLNTNTGQVDVAPGTPVGTYYLTYKICMVDNTNDCDLANVTVEVIKLEADLSITKTASKDPVKPDETFTYTISVKNNGPDNATGVSVEDILPNSLNLVNANPSVGNWSAPDWTIGNLSSGATKTLILTVSAKSSASGSIQNTATVSSNTNDPNSNNNSATKTIQVTPLSADLEVTKAASKNPVKPGETFTYTVTVKNNGPDAAANVSVEDILPSSLNLVEANPSVGNWNSPDWTIGNLANGATKTLSMTVSVKANASGNIVNTAEVTSTTADPNSENNTATKTVQVSDLNADLEITKTASKNPVDPGETFTYTITVKNNGPDQAKNVSVEDILPSSLNFVEANASVGNWNSPDWTIGNLANGATKTLSMTVSVKANASGNIVNTAEVTSTTADPNTENNTATKVVAIEIIQLSADLEITKTASKNPVKPGESFTYVITVKNNGPDAATDVKVQDVLPSSLNLNGVNPSIGTWSAPNWTIGNLANGATKTLSMNVSVKSNASGSISNTATVSSTTTDPNTNNNSSTKTIGVDDPDDIINHFPASGYGTLAFEDLWPGKGDYDFNDLVLDYQFEIITNTNNKVDQVKGTFIIKAFGAALENGFGFQLSDNILASDLYVTGYSLTENIITLNNNGTENRQSKPTIIVYDNAFNQMSHPGIGTGVNTDPAAPYVTPDTIHITIDFPANKYSYNELDISNFNPFLIVNLDRGIEVHLPDYPPTDLADRSHFKTFADNTNPSAGIYYKTENNLPWVIHIYENFAYPSEKKDITWSHLKFAEWAKSGGINYSDWYQNKTGYRNTSNIYQQPF